MDGANYLLLAPSRAGKSWYAAHQLFLKQPPALYIDPKATDTFLKEAAKRDDVLRFFSVDYLQGCRERVYPYLILTGHLTYDIVDETEKLLEWIIGLRLADPKMPPVMLVVDEAGRFMQKQSNAIPALQKLICEGRGYGVSTAILAQHPNQVPNLFIENANYILTWPSMGNDGRCQGMSPIIIEYLEQHGYPMPEEAKQWATKPYHGLMIDGTEYLHVRPDGSLQRPTGQEVEDEETGEDADKEVEADAVPEAGAKGAVPGERPEVPAVGGDGAGAGPGAGK
jgi:hypothetical protein